MLVVIAERREMPLYVVFGVAVPPWCMHDAIFWKLVQDIKELWYPYHEEANIGVGHPMGYCVGLQPGGSCACHLTLLICLTMFDLRDKHLYKCSRAMKRYFREEFYRSQVPDGQWFRMYLNKWCQDPNYRVGKYLVSTGAVRDICGWVRCTGLRFGDKVYTDEISVC
ncbi:hypothetical protein [Fowl adenovirus]|uniref:ORF17 n=1 Tax=Fowl aviadenovirus D TaxID=190064 RepID=A0A6N0C240_9ADEN|nr:hypothetical protein [Fowl adenovirus]QKO28745.1 ORF17 [Fowl aviadenovirus D]